MPPKGSKKVRLSESETSEAAPASAEVTTAEDTPAPQYGPVREAKAAHSVLAVALPDAIIENLRLTAEVLGWSRDDVAEAVFRAFQRDCMTLGNMRAGHKLTPWYARGVDAGWK